VYLRLRSIFAAILHHLTFSFKTKPGHKAQGPWSSPSRGPGHPHAWTKHRKASRRLDGHHQQWLLPKRRRVYHSASHHPHNNEVHNRLAQAPPQLRSENNVPATQLRPLLDSQRSSHQTELSALSLLGQQLLGEVGRVHCTSESPETNCNHSCLYLIIKQLQLFNYLSLSKRELCEKAINLFFFNFRLILESKLGVTTGVILKSQLIYNTLWRDSLRGI